MAESIEVRARVPESIYAQLREKAPGGDDLSDAELVRYWLQFGIRQHDLQVIRAVGERPQETTESQEQAH